MTTKEKLLFEVTVYFYPRTVVVEAEDAADAAQQATDGLRDIEDIDVQIKERDPDACDKHYLWQDTCADCSRKFRELMEANDAPE